MPRRFARLPGHSVYAIAQMGVPALEGTLAAVMRRISAGEEIEDGAAADAQRHGLPVAVDSGVAVISVDGVMIPGAWFAADTDAVTEAVAASASDEEVKCIVMRFNTPGGSVIGTAELADGLNAARAQKPVIAQVTGLCCSAGYLAACACDEIYAGRMDLVGSIGTRQMLYDFSEYFAKEGIKAIPIDTGHHKSAGAMGTEITDAQKAEFQRVVDAYFADFLGTVVKGRQGKMSKDQVVSAADGRVWTASEAMKLGLIDGTRTMAQTMALARSKAAAAVAAGGARAMVRTRAEQLATLG